MSESLHHHDEPWDDMALPNEEEAWQKMKHLLDKEDRRRRFLPFWFWRYGLLGLLMFGLAAGGYFWLNQRERPKAGNGVTKETSRQQEKDKQAKEQLQPGKETNSLEHSAVVEQEVLKMQRSPEATSIAVLKKETTVNSISLRQTGKSRMEKTSGKKQAYSVKLETKRLPASHSADEPGKQQNNSSITPESVLPAMAAESKNFQKPTDSLKQVAAGLAKDSVAATDSAKLAAAPLVVNNGNKTGKTKKKNRYLLSAGVGLQQAIAFNGQQSSAYNLKGEKNKLSDRIPAVYVRLQKERWFLLGEWQYRVPQLVAPFSYSQTTLYNTVQAELQTERTTMQKLYYHQLPLSLNYFLLPQWSAGIGGTYNWLAGAVTEQETETKNLANGTESTRVTVVPVKGFRDSFLYRSTAGLLLQTDYHWKRFSFGLRYTANLQSFIRYTKPDGTVADEKNQVLQAVLRFRIIGGREAAGW